MRWSGSVGLCLVLAATLASGAQAAPPVVELAETAPTETTLDQPDLGEASALWPKMIDEARKTLDVAQFYVIRSPTGRLEPVIAAVERAAKRGVRVRILADRKFHKTYPDELDRLGALRGIEVRLYAPPGKDGVLHTKLFIVDGAQVWVGSQNFDWRSLEHVQELGVRLRIPEIAGAFADVFALDWALAGDPNAKVPPPRRLRASSFPIEVKHRGASVALTPVFSPIGLLPEESLWDLPRIIALIDGAKERVRIQVLGYKAGGYKGGWWGDLDNAIRRADGRRVHVELMVSNWGTSKSKLESIKSLQVLDRVTVKVVGLPEHSSGFIPFARTIHAKIMTVDGARGWLGTSNWSRDYFYESRNAGLIFEGASFAGALDRFFETTWSSKYAEVLDPSRQYKAPRRK